MASFSSLDDDLSVVDDEDASDEKRYHHVAETKGTVASEPAHQSVENHALNHSSDDTAQEEHWSTFAEKGDSAERGEGSGSVEECLENDLRIHFHHVMHERSNQVAHLEGKSEKMEHSRLFRFTGVNHLNHEVDWDSDRNELHEESTEDCVLIEPHSDGAN